MKIKLITLKNLKGDELIISNLLSIRFEISENPEDWIDIIPYENGIQLHSSPTLSIFPQAANAVNVLTTREKHG